ncbi:MAG: WD40 repeat domain-containing protein [Planctomycetes bacterium]|nr:WD40 repeat domain-containing protein [Planctomycetota bacterium]
MATIKLWTGLMLAVLAAESALATGMPPGARLRLGTLNFRHHDYNRVYRVAFAGGNTLITCSSNGGTGAIIVWDLVAGKERRRYKVDQLEAVSRDGKMMAIGRYGPERGRDIIVVDVSSGKQLRRLHVPAAQLRRADFSADGATLVTGSDDRMIRAWAIATGKVVRQFPTSEDDACDPGPVAMSPNGKTFLSEGTRLSTTLYGWDIAAGKSTHQLKASSGVYSKDGDSVIAVANANWNGLIFWDAATGKEQKRLKVGGPSISALRLTPDGTTLVLASSGGPIRFLDLATEKVIQTLPWSYEYSDRLAFSPDSRTLATGGWGGAVRLWDWRAGKELLPIGHEAAVFALAFSPDSKRLISAGADNSVRVWGLPSGKQLHRWDCFRPGLHTHDIESMAVFPDGKSAALGNTVGNLRVLDLNTGSQRSFKDAQIGIHPAAVSRDGKRFITFPRDQHRLEPLGLKRADMLTCTLWDAAGGTKVRAFTHTVKNPPRFFSGSRITDAAFAPDGKSVAAAWEIYFRGHSYHEPLAYGISIWDADTGKETRIEALATTLAFLDDGKTLASVAFDQDAAESVIRFWDVATGKERRTLRLPSQADRFFAFSPNGKFFASPVGPDGNAIGVWQTATGNEVRRFDGHRDSVCSLAFSPDGRMLASGSADTTILIWEILGLR